MVYRIALVVSDFNYDVTHPMRDAALSHAKKRGLKVTRVMHVGGSYDAPYAVSLALKKKDVDGVVAIGAVIKGETQHDEVIAHATAHTLQRLAIKFNKPVALAITGPGITLEQARARTQKVPEHAVDALIQLLDLRAGKQTAARESRTHAQRYR